MGARPPDPRRPPVAVLARRCVLHRVPPPRGARDQAQASHAAHEGADISTAAQKKTTAWHVWHSGDRRMSQQSTASGGTAAASWAGAADGTSVCLGGSVGHPAQLVQVLRRRGKQSGISSLLLSRCPRGRPREAPPLSNRAPNRRDLPAQDGDLVDVHGCATDYLLRSLHVSICDARRAASCTDAAASRSEGCA